jgi:hypothetical protein
MADDVLINKAASIERCVARVREEYQALLLPITIGIITEQLGDFLTFSKTILQHRA